MEVQVYCLILTFDISISLNETLHVVQVSECHVIVDPRTRESRGFGFVTMETVEGAERCVKYLNRSVLEGRLITVQKVA